MKKRKLQPAVWLRQNKLSCLVLLAALVLFAAVYWVVQPEEDDSPAPAEYVEYDTGTILEILTDNTTQNPVDDGGWRGEQLMLVEVTSGQYKGETLPWKWVTVPYSPSPPTRTVPIPPQYLSTTGLCPSPSLWFCS